ncbi:hypothetical protein TNCV_329271 [Trichonephila clavipes]|nr:hypothetical protein TNCV_329271 [Trichonephila clavipes]
MITVVLGLILAYIDTTSPHYPASDSVNRRPNDTIVMASVVASIVFDELSVVSYGFDGMSVVSYGFDGFVASCGFDGFFGCSCGGKMALREDCAVSKFCQGHQ